MTKKDLIPFNTRPREEHLALSAKGGRSKSPTKQLASRINGLLNSPHLSSQKKVMMQYLRDKRYVDLINELISMNLEEAEDSEMRNRTIVQLQQMIPKQGVLLAANVGMVNDEGVKRIMSLLSSERKIPKEELEGLSKAQEQAVVESWEKSTMGDLENE